MTDAAALDQAVRENRDVIRRGLAKPWTAQDEMPVWCEGAGYVPIATIDLICVSYRRIVAKGERDGTVEHIS